MSSDMALRFSGLLKVMIPTPSVTRCRIFPSARDFSLAGTSSIGEAFELKDKGSGSQEWTEIRPRESRPRLYVSPPLRDAGMIFRLHLLGRDLLIDPLCERHRRDIGDRIGLADQPAGGRERLFHLVQQLHQFGPRRVALFLGVGLARHPQPGF